MFLAIYSLMKVIHCTERQMIEDEEVEGHIDIDSVVLALF